MDSVEHDVYVVYHPNRGFLSGRKNIQFKKEFKHARVFTRRADAVNSTLHQRNISEGELYVIPVRLTLDPKKLFTQVLSGSNG